MLNAECRMPLEHEADVDEEEGAGEVDLADRAVEVLHVGSLEVELVAAADREEDGVEVELELERDDGERGVVDVEVLVGVLSQQSWGTVMGTEQS